jgi:hypothetical protein
MSDTKSGPPTTKIKLIIVCLLMTISTVLAAIDIYARLNPPKVETVKPSRRKRITPCLGPEPSRKQRSYCL